MVGGELSSWRMKGWRRAQSFPPFARTLAPTDSGAVRYVFEPAPDHCLGGVFGMRCAAFRGDSTGFPPAAASTSSVAGWRGNEWQHSCGERRQSSGRSEQVNGFFFFLVYRGGDITRGTSLPVVFAFMWLCVSALTFRKKRSLQTFVLRVDIMGLAATW